MSKMCRVSALDFRSLFYMSYDIADTTCVCSVRSIPLNTPECLAAGSRVLSPGNICPNGVDIQVPRLFGLRKILRVVHCT